MKLRKKFQIAAVLAFLLPLGLKTCASANPWLGSYDAAPKISSSKTRITKLFITKGKGGQLNVSVRITDPDNQEMELRAEGHADPFINCNAKGIHDTLIASISADNRRILLVIRRGPPWSLPKVKLRYRELPYTCYFLDDKWHRYIEGTVVRQASKPTESSEP